MIIRKIVDATLGRLFLPLRSTTDAQPGAVWLDGKRPWLRGNDLSTTLLRVITSDEVGAASGVAPLDSGGKIPLSVLPPEVVTAGGAGGGGASGGLIGEVRMWFGDVFALPSGWLVCDGSDIPQSQYASLFAVVGHRAGRPSNYSTHFRLPDLVGRVPVGATGPNDAASGRVHKINIVNPGVGFTNGTYTGVVLAGAGATITTAPTVTIVVASGSIVRVDVESGGNVAISPTRTVSGFGTSNCDLIIPSFGGSTASSAMFEYEVTLAPISNAAQAWGVRMTDGGAGYTSAPKVTITGGGVTGATAVAILEGDSVREVVITNPGSGSVSGASVAFSGGGPSTPAAATVVFYDAPATVGDLGGEAAHMQLKGELAAHRHGLNVFGVTDAAGNTNATVNNETKDDLTVNRRTGETGASDPMAWRPSYTGVLFIIYAGV